MTAPTPTPAAPESPSRKPRNTVELWIVRGGIALLVALVAVQAHARFGYEMTLKRLQDRLAKEDEMSLPLLVTDAEKMIFGFPSQSERSDRHWRQRTYSWRGLTQSYQIIMPYDNSEEQPVIMSLVTANPPPMPEPVYEKETAPLPSLAGMAGPGAPGPGGGGPRPDPMANDKDGDGKLSKDEASERMAANFEQWDANSDGFVDKDEIDAARARFRAQRGEGGGGPGGGARPRRPAAEASAPAETPTEQPVAEEKPADAATVTPARE
ncbi:MAG TPA: hypothetical protein VFG20_07575 [Planctomycetaceae bacterium]|nr:hypothetical protein [Planctomycetaceae bacterium]